MLFLQDDHSENLPVNCDTPYPTSRARGVLARAVLSALCCALAACASTAPAPVERGQAARGDTSAKTKQLDFKLGSGTYRCDAGQLLEIQRDTRNGSQLTLSWQGTRHTLRRYDSDSGLPRFEDRDSGLTWIDLPWKSMLMDSASGRPLASDCKAPKA